MSGNPYSAKLRETFPDGVPEFPLAEISAGVAILASAEAFWDLLDALPNKAEAVLAQHRLEETVYWAGRAGA